MRWIVLLVASLVASPVTAGTVVAMTFGDTTAPRDVLINGVAASSSGGFVLYRHGRWSRPAASEPATTPTTPSTDVVTTQSPALQTSDDCSARAIPWRSGLSTRTILGRAAYWPIVRDAECRHGLPGGLLDALVLQESRYQPAAVSTAGAGGLAQLMPGTAADLGVTNRFDPVANVEGGARYLRSMLRRYNSIPLALAAYNAGLGAVDRAGGIPANSETPNYVSRVLGFWGHAATTHGGSLLVSRAVSLSFSSPNQE